MDLDTAVQGLAEAFARNGYVRRQNAARAQELGWARYKKGDEVRLGASDEEELQRLRDMLKTAGFKPGSPYAQGRGWRQPIYGRTQVAVFLMMVEAAGLASNKRIEQKAQGGMT